MTCTPLGVALWAWTSKCLRQLKILPTLRCHNFNWNVRDLIPNSQQVAWLMANTVWSTRLRIRLIFYKSLLASSLATGILNHFTSASTCPVFMSNSKAGNCSVNCQPYCNYQTPVQKNAGSMMFTTWVSWPCIVTSAWRMTLLTLGTSIILS